MREICEKLFLMQDIAYRDFHAKLIPEIKKDRIIGVRTPALRKYAKEVFALNDYSEFLKELPHRYYEENNLHGFLIEQCKDFEECVALLDEFLPYVDNWATCDMIKPTAFKKNRKKLRPLIKKWISSQNCFEVRFGIKCVMDYFLDEDFTPEYLDIIANIHSEEYYIKMMQAWFFATSLAKQYEVTVKLFEKNVLEKWVRNKALQKAAESRRIPNEVKVHLKTLHLK